MQKLKILKTAIIYIFFMGVINYLNFNVTSDEIDELKEIVTITTYYPAPYGAYIELRVDRLSIGTRYRNQPIANGTIIVEDTIGVGVTNPDQNLSLDTARPVKIGRADGLVCNSLREGTIRYNHTLQQFQYCSQNSWRRLGILECHHVTVNLEPGSNIQNIVNSANFYLNGKDNTAAKNIAELKLIPLGVNATENRIALVCINGYVRTGCYREDPATSQLTARYDLDIYGDVPVENACVIDDDFARNNSGYQAVRLTAVCCQ